MKSLILSVAVAAAIGAIPVASAESPAPAPGERLLAGLSVTVYWPPSEEGRREVVTDAVADELRDLGVETVRMVFWTHGGEIAWDAYDRIVERLTSRGIGILGLLDNQIVSAPRDEWNDADYRRRFAAAVAEVVGRYHDRIDDWEVWNEEDFHDFAVEPEAYGALLTETFRTIRGIDPDATVALGGLASTWDVSGRYLRRVYESSAVRAWREETGAWPFDVVCVHPYHWKISPDTYLAEALQRNILLVMAAHGDGDKPIWLTEIGWNLDPGHPTGLGLPRVEAELVQALHLTRLFATAASATRDPLSDRRLVDRVYWFEYRGAFGLQNLAGDPHRSFEAYRAAARALREPPGPAETAAP